MIKILTIVGARPQIIKAAALSRAIKLKFSDEISESILHTGQHYDDNMSEIFFREMGIPIPQYNLHVGSGSHGEQTAKMIQGIESTLLNEHFNAIVLFGDTNSTLAGAIAAAKIHMPIIHIEAGLRSYNMAMPEEQNRIICDQLSTLLFCPTETAVSNLEMEGFKNSKATFRNGKSRIIYNSGDIMYDNSIYFGSIIEKKTNIIADLGLSQDNFILATIHRNNNTDEPQRLNSIFEAILEISTKHKIKTILPIHPRTKKLLKQNLSPILYSKIKNSEHIIIIPPASFFEMIALEKAAKIIFTDSGGVQKEAYFFEKPCVIMRSETEWVEIIEQNAGIIADADKGKIISAFEELTNKKINYPKLFGNAKAAEFILNKIISEINS